MNFLLPAAQVSMQAALPETLTRRRLSYAAGAGCEAGPETGPGDWFAILPWLTEMKKPCYYKYFFIDVVLHPGSIPGSQPVPVRHQTDGIAALPPGCFFARLELPGTALE